MDEYLSPVSVWREEYGYEVKLPSVEKEGVIWMILDDGLGPEFLTYLVSRWNIYERRGLTDVLKRTIQDFSFTRENLPEIQEEELRDKYLWATMNVKEERYPLRRFLKEHHETETISTESSETRTPKTAKIVNIPKIHLLDTNVLFDQRCFRESSTDMDAKFRDLCDDLASGKNGKWIIPPTVAYEAPRVIKNKFDDDLKIKQKLKILSSSLPKPLTITQNHKRKVAEFFSKIPSDVWEQLWDWKCRYKSPEEKEAIKKNKRRYSPIGRGDAEILEMGVCYREKYPNVSIITGDWDFHGLDKYIMDFLGVKIHRWDSSD